MAARWSGCAHSLVATDQSLMTTDKGQRVNNLGPSHGGVSSILSPPVSQWDEALVSSVADMVGGQLRSL